MFLLTHYSSVRSDLSLSFEVVIASHTPDCLTDPETWTHRSCGFLE
jgi:hypothetical protein